MIEASEHRTRLMLIDGAIVVLIVVTLNLVRFGTRWPTGREGFASSPLLAWVASIGLLAACIAVALRVIGPHDSRSIWAAGLRAFAAVVLGSAILIGSNAVMSATIQRQLPLSTVNLGVLAIVGPVLFVAVRSARMGGPG